MELQPAPIGDRPFVRAYGPGGFTIGESRFEGSVLLLPDRVECWAPADPQLLVAEDFRLLQPLGGGAVSLLVLGLGACSRPLSGSLLATVRGWGIAVEAAPTPAACRIWNLVLAEERRAAAALLALPRDAGSVPTRRETSPRT